MNHHPHCATGVQELKANNATAVIPHHHRWGGQGECMPSVGVMTNINYCTYANHSLHYHSLWQLSTTCFSHGARCFVGHPAIAALESSPVGFALAGWTSRGSGAHEPPHTGRNSIRAQSCLEYGASRRNGGCIFS
jgi:hypothetical protein